MQSYIIELKDLDSNSNYLAFSTDLWFLFQVMFPYCK